MVDVITEILIDRPRNIVAGFAAEPDNAPLWYKNIKSVQWKTPKSLAVRSQIAFEAEFLWKKLSYVYEIAEFIPGEKLIMRTSKGPFPMETTYVWESFTNDKTKMTLRNRGNPTGFSKFVAPFMAWAMKRENQKDLQQLKELLESK
jgi:hypothetical protein